MKNVTKQGKSQPKFHVDPYQVIQKKGSMVVARRGNEVKTRNSSHFKRVISDDQPLVVLDEPEEPEYDDSSPSPDMREEVIIPDEPLAQPSPRSPRPPSTIATPSVSRPRRTINMPKYLADYDCKMLKLSNA